MKYLRETPRLASRRPMHVIVILAWVLSVLFMGLIGGFAQSYLDDARLKRIVSRLELAQSHAQSERDVCEADFRDKMTAIKACKTNQELQAELYRGWAWGSPPDLRDWNMQTFNLVIGPQPKSSWSVK